MEETIARNSFNCFSYRWHAQVSFDSCCHTEIESHFHRARLSNDEVQHKVKRIGEREKKLDLAIINSAARARAATSRSFVISPSIECRLQA